MWIESHQELGSHPKTQKLARILGLSKPTVVGHLQYLWWWATDYAQEGDLSRFDPLDIAIGAEWEGNPDLFLDALIRAGFVDRDEDGGGLSIHDWHDYAGKLIERRAKNAERMRAARADTKPKRATHVQGTQRARATLPNTTKQNTTKQNTTEPNQTLGEESPKPSLRARAKTADGFERFYGEYPRKTGRADAERAWRKLDPSPELQGEIMAAVARQQTWESWQSGFIPHPATFLNGRRWEDEEPPRKQAQHSNGNGRASPVKETTLERNIRNLHAAFDDEPEPSYDNVFETKGFVRQ